MDILEDAEKLNQIATYIAKKKVLQFKKFGMKHLKN